MGIMTSNIPEKSTKYSLNGQRGLLSEVCVLLSLILVMPATNASSCQELPAIYNDTGAFEQLHVHKERTDDLSLIDIGNEFVHGSVIVNIYLENS